MVCTASQPTNYIISLVTSSSMTSLHKTRLNDYSTHKCLNIKVTASFSVYVSCLPFCPQGYITGELLLRSKPRGAQFNAHIAHQSHCNAHPAHQPQFNAHPDHQSQVGNSSACHCLRLRPHAAVSSMPLKTQYTQVQQSTTVQ